MYSVNYIKKKLFPKVNRDKISIKHIEKIKFLEVSSYNKQGRIRAKLYLKSVTKMKLKINQYASRNKEYGIGKLKRYIRGLINYFKISDIKTLLKHTDE